MSNEKTMLDIVRELDRKHQAQLGEGTTAEKYGECLIPTRNDGQETSKLVDELVKFWAKNNFAPPRRSVRYQVWRELVDEQPNTKITYWHAARTDGNPTNRTAFPTWQQAINYANQKAAEANQ